MRSLAFLALLAAAAAVAAAQAPPTDLPAPADDAGAATAHAAPLRVDPALRAALDAAEAAQEERDEPAAPVLAHVIKQAPAAELASGTGDVDTAGELGVEATPRDVGRRARARCGKKPGGWRPSWWPPRRERGPRFGWREWGCGEGRHATASRETRAHRRGAPDAGAGRPAPLSPLRRLRGRHRRLLRRRGRGRGPAGGLPVGASAAGGAGQRGR